MNNLRLLEFNNIRQITGFVDDNKHSKTVYILYIKNPNYHTNKQWTCVKMLFNLSMKEPKGWQNWFSGR